MPAKLKSFAFLLLLTIFSTRSEAQSITFSKYLTNNPNNVDFITASMLSNNRGYLMLADKYTTQRITYVIRTDSALNEVWARQFTFPQTSSFTYSYTYDVGEMPSGNYYIFGQAGDTTALGHLWYVLIVLDTNGLILHQTAIRETSHSVNGANVPRIRFGIDSSVIIVASEYDWMGFYRFDENLNFLSQGFYQLGNNINTWGNAGIMLSDTNLLFSGTNANNQTSFVKTDRQGNVLWNKAYSGPGKVFSLYEAPDKSIYAGGFGAYAYMCRLDSVGNMLWYKEYANTSNQPSGVVYDIFPMQNGHLMINGDSLIFETDTAGIPLNPAYRQPGYLPFEFKTAGPDFMISDQLFQLATMSYMPTVMRFNALSGSSCMALRTVNVNNQSWGTLPSPISHMNATVLQLNPNCIDTTVFVGFDPLDGCPAGPAAVAESKPLPNQFTVFPNPASDEIHLQFANGKNATAEIIDLTGRVIYVEQLSSEQRDYVFSTSTFSEGIYFIRIKQNETVIGSQRFAVVK